LNGAAAPNMALGPPSEGDQFEASSIVMSDRTEEAAALPHEEWRESYACLVDQPGCQKGAVHARAGVHSEGVDTTPLMEASERRLEIQPSTAEHFEVDVDCAQTGVVGLRCG
jgi:hypothetical protein